MHLHCGVNLIFMVLIFGFSTIFGYLITYESAAYFFSYGGLIYDLFVGSMLLYSKTFWIGIILTIGFHCTNKFLFNIGIFPYVMIASTSLFFHPDWVRKLFHYINNPKKQYIPIAKPISFKQTKIRKLTKKEKISIIIVCVFLIWWIGFPLRNYFLPGNVAWNEEGHMVIYFSSFFNLFVLIYFLVFLENEIKR